MANHGDRHGSEPDRTLGRGGHAHGDGHRAGRHSNDVAGERDRPAELPLFGRRHVASELGARQGAAVRDAGPSPGIHGRDRRSVRKKVAVGRDLYLKNPQNQIGLTGGSDPRIDEIHVVHKCSSKKTPALHICGPVERRMGRRRHLRDAPRQRHPAGPAAVHLLHPEAHLLRALRRNDRSCRPSRRAGGQSEQHGLLVPERRSRAVRALHDVDAARRRTSTRQAESRTTRSTGARLPPR